MRHVTDTGLELIKKHEGFRPYVYDDATGRRPVGGVFRGYPTIGYGHLIKKGEHFPDEITEAEATEILRKDVHIAERGVLRNINAPLADEHFDALVSFTFNLGTGALQRSTLRAKLNREEYAAIPAEFRKWVYFKGRRLRGLIRRRNEEADLFAVGTDMITGRLTTEPPADKIGFFVLPWWRKEA